MTKQRHKPLVVRRRVLFQNARRQGASTLDKRRIIEQCERLDGNIRPIATRAGGDQVWCVEQRQHRMRCQSPDPGVQAASVAVLACADRPCCWRGPIVENAVGLIWKDTRSTNAVFLQTADGKRNVADDLRFQPQPSLSGEPKITWVDESKIRPTGR